MKIVLTVGVIVRKGFPRNRGSRIGGILGMYIRLHSRVIVGTSRVAPSTIGQIVATIHVCKMDGLVTLD